ncbi:unnamed protein product [Moneuplotes crassus]|uniref:EF-hand domain-containing protein n=1 Tax=Euplotes crassus TaxID=5936 RepID=A0AAD1UQT5_EUPCR|nr:unnamed protein product [Moneuplotes crassus]
MEKIAKPQAFSKEEQNICRRQFVDQFLSTVSDNKSAMNIVLSEAQRRGLYTIASNRGRSYDRGVLVNYNFNSKSTSNAQFTKKIRFKSNEAYANNTFRIDISQKSNHKMKLGKIPVVKRKKRLIKTNPNATSKKSQSPSRKFMEREMQKKNFFKLPIIKGNSNTEQRKNNKSVNVPETSQFKNLNKSLESRKHAEKQIRKSMAVQMALKKRVLLDDSFETDSDQSSEIDVHKLKIIPGANNIKIHQIYLNPSNKRLQGKLFDIFKKICNKSASISEKQLKFEKNDLKAYLMKRYPPNICEALLQCFSISLPVDFTHFVEMMESYMNLPMELHKYIAFDAYDTNDDSKIGEYDLFILIKNLSDDIFLTKVSEDMKTIYNLIKSKKKVEALRSRLKLKEERKSQQSSLHSSYNFSAAHKAHLRVPKGTLKLPDSLSIHENFSPTLITLKEQQSRSASPKSIVSKKPKIKNTKKSDWMPLLSKEDTKSESITVEEFQALRFEHKWPMIIIDFIKYLTSIDLIKRSTGPVKRTPERIFDKKKASEMLEKAKELVDETTFVDFLEIFKTLVHNPQEKYEELLFINYESLDTNLVKILGYEQPLFTKMLYYYLSDGYDYKKIVLYDFIEKLLPFYQVNMREMNKKIKEMYAMHKDKEVSITTLLHAQTQIDSDCQLGEEVHSLTNEYVKFLLNNHNNDRERIINHLFEIYMPTSCIISELCINFFKLGRSFINFPVIRDQSILKTEKKHQKLSLPSKKDLSKRTYEKILLEFVDPKAAKMLHKSFGKLYHKFE